MVGSFARFLLCTCCDHNSFIKIVSTRRPCINSLFSLYRYVYEGWSWPKLIASIMQFICDTMQFIYDVMQFICGIMQFIYAFMQFVCDIMHLFLFCYAPVLFYWALWMRHAPAFYRHIASTLSYIMLYKPLDSQLLECPKLVVLFDLSSDF